MQLVSPLHKFFNRGLPDAFGEVDVRERHHSVLRGVAIVDFDLSQLAQHLRGDKRAAGAVRQNPCGFHEALCLFGFLRPCCCCVFFV